MSPHKRARGSVLSSHGQEFNAAWLSSAPLDISSEQTQRWIGLPLETKQRLCRQMMTYAVDKVKPTLKDDYAALGLRESATIEEARFVYLNAVTEINPEINFHRFMQVHKAFERLMAYLEDRIRNHNDFVGPFLEEWERHYCDEYGLTVDASKIFIPIRRPGFDWLEIVPQGIFCNQVFAKCEELFPCWRYTSDLDAALARNDRQNFNRAYAIWLRARPEADEELKNLSANDLDALGHSGIILLERLILEPWYFKKTNDHLDKKNATLCSGSRHSGGDVPTVYWGDGRLLVSSSGPSRARASLRARSVVS